MVRSSRRFARVVAAVCGVAVLLGATACDNSGSTMKAGIGQESGPTLDTDGEPFIHANHNRGGDPNIRVGQVDQKGLEDYTDELTDWGLQQTSDWLEICNTINKHELRQLGIDPQKDLLERQPGEGKRWACGWKHDVDQLVMIGWRDATLEEASSAPEFYTERKSTVNGRPAVVGRVDTKKSLAKECGVNYYYQGKVYRLAYKITTEPVADDQACNTALALAERD